MTLRMEQVVGQIPGVVERFRQQLDAMDAGLRAAGAALTRWSTDPAGGNAAIEAAMQKSPIPYATTLEDCDPAAVFAAPPFAPVTVVAADGSSIEPDRFAPVQCYVINTGFVVLPYGIERDADLGSQPVLGPEAPGGGNDGEDDGDDAVLQRGWGVNLLRDVRELETAVRLAAERIHDGPVAMLLDGTLFPWDLDSRQVAEAVRRDCKDRTLACLDGLSYLGEGLSPGAYISGSRSADVVTSLRALAGGDPVSWPLADSQLFRGLLADGQRSALFRARSERTQVVENMFDERHRVCFFYLRVGDDIARVELPQWAATPERVDRLHATLLDQCSRCDGYPRALQEAHEQAVITGGDRLQFSRLLEDEAARQGLHAAANSKQMSKRRRAL